MTSPIHETPFEGETAGLGRFLAARPGGRDDVPPDVEPGSDADIDRPDEPDKDTEDSEAGSEATEPSPGEADPDSIESGEGEQMDDNIDDLGRRPDGTMQDQPGIGKLA